MASSHLNKERTSHFISSPISFNKEDIFQVIKVECRDCGVKYESPESKLQALIKSRLTLEPKAIAEFREIYSDENETRVFDARLRRGVARLPGDRFDIIMELKGIRSILKGQTIKGIPTIISVVLASNLTNEVRAG